MNDLRLPSSPPASYGIKSCINQPTWVQRYSLINVSLKVRNGLASCCHPEINGSSIIQSQFVALHPS